MLGHSITEKVTFLGWKRNLREEMIVWRQQAQGKKAGRDYGVNP